LVPGHIDCQGTAYFLASRYACMYACMYALLVCISMYVFIYYTHRPEYAHKCMYVSAPLNMVRAPRLLGNQILKLLLANKPCVRCVCVLVCVRLCVCACVRAYVNTKKNTKYVHICIYI